MILKHFGWLDDAIQNGRRDFEKSRRDSSDNFFIYVFWVEEICFVGQKVFSMGYIYVSPLFENSSPLRVPADTWRNNNVIITSKWHCNVVLT